MEKTITIMHKYTRVYLLLGVLIIAIIAAIYSKGALNKGALITKEIGSSKIANVKGSTTSTTNTCPSNSQIIKGADILAALKQDTPYTIKNSGTYCLGEDIIINPQLVLNQIQVDKSVISIEADSVILDLNKHVFGSSTPSTSYSNPGQSNNDIIGLKINNYSSPLSYNSIEVKNGTIKNFGLGILSYNSTNVTFKDLLLFTNYRSIVLERGKNIDIENNKISNTYAGIDLGWAGEYLKDVNIKGNKILLEGNSNTTGIIVLNPTDFIIENNQISSKKFTSDTLHHGITILSGKNGKITKNTLKNIATGIVAAQFGVMGESLEEITISENIITDTQNISVPNDPVDGTPQDVGIDIWAEASGINVYRNTINNYKNGTLLQSNFNMPNLVTISGDYNYNTTCNVTNPLTYYGTPTVNNFNIGTQNTNLLPPC